MTGSDTEDVSRPRGGVHTVLRLIRMVWSAGRTDLQIRIVLAFLALVLAKVINTAVPYLYKTAVDGLTAEDAAAAVIVVPIMIIVAYGVARFGAVAFTEMRDGLFAKVGEHSVRMIARRTFEHLHALSLRFHLERRTGALSRIMERGNEAVETIIRVALFNIVPTIVELIFVAVILAVFLDLRFSAILLVTVGLYAWFTIRLTEWRVKIRRVMNEADSDAYSKAVDSLLNYETVKYFGNEGHEAARFDRAMAAYEKAAVRTTVSAALLNAGQSAIFSVGLVASMLLAGIGVAAGTLTVGDFVMVNAYLIQVYVPLNFLGFVHRQINQGLVDIERLFALLGEKPEIVDRPEAAPLAVKGGEVRFEGVAFAYESTRPILHEATFAVAPGRTLAIVGPSGAGKSTLSRLLFRFYDVTAGRILIDGQDVRDVTQDSLRTAIGMVPQDTVLFNDTIAYNIRYGRTEASDAEVEEAARLAQIHDFVAGLPEGYETVVGERGLKLSGGEKQRVAIARTILKGPPILVLDEATSALDSVTEKEIQEALRAVARGRTTLVIAHRLSTVADADEIIVLVNGRIVERGTHQTLIDASGHYAAMWARQRQAEEAEATLKAARADDAGETREEGDQRTAAGESPGRRDDTATVLEQIEN